MSSTEVFPNSSTIIAPFGSRLTLLSFKNAVFGLTPVAIITKSASYSPLFVITFLTFSSPTNSLTISCNLKSTL